MCYSQKAPMCYENREIIENMPTMFNIHIWFRVRVEGYAFRVCTMWFWHILWIPIDYFRMFPSGKDDFSFRTFVFQILTASRWKKFKLYVAKVLHESEMSKCFYTFFISIEILYKIETEIRGNIWLLIYERHSRSGELFISLYSLLG